MTQLTTHNPTGLATQPELEAPASWKHQIQLKYGYPYCVLDLFTRHDTAGELQIRSILTLKLLNLNQNQPRNFRIFTIKIVRQQYQEVGFSSPIVQPNYGVKSVAKKCPD
jgi:hypothetical protein